MKKIDIERKNALKLFSQIENPYVAIAEAIKNSWDADATEVNISIDTLKKTVEIKDNGTGVKQPLSVANSEKIILTKTKKQRNIVGNKGIGIWSLYSLGNKLEILSKYENNIEKYIYNNDEFERREDCNLESLGEWITIIKIMNISKLTIDSLAHENFKNFLNVFIFNFENLEIDFNVNLIVDGKIEELMKKKIEDDTLDYPSVYLEKASSFTSEFEYINGVLKIKIKTKENEVYIGSNTYIELDLNKLDQNQTNEKIKKFILANYNFKQGPKIIKKWFLKDEELNIGIPNFKGRLFTLTGNKKKESKNYLNGTYVYIENFNLYNFSYDNDWIGWTETSQNWKVNDLKLKNVYSYIKFDNFNENTLKISQQRSGFITDSYYENFLVILSEILKTILTSANHGSHKNRHIPNEYKEIESIAEKSLKSKEEQKEEKIFKVEEHLNSNEIENNIKELVNKKEKIISEEGVEFEKIQDEIKSFKIEEYSDSNEVENNIKESINEKEEIRYSKKNIPLRQRTNVTFPEDLKSFTKGIALNSNNERKKVLDCILKEIEFLGLKVNKKERNNINISLTLLTRTLIENIIIYIAIEKGKNDLVKKQYNFKSLTGLIESDLLKEIFGKDFDKIKEIIFKRQKVNGQLIIKDMIETINSYPHNPMNNKINYLQLEPVLLELKFLLKEKFYYKNPGQTL